MRLSWDHPSINPAELYELLHRNGLLQAQDNAKLLEGIRATAMISRYGLVLDDDDRVLASFLYWPIQPHILGFQWIPEVKRLHTKRDELIALGEELRTVWFRGGVTRVEAHVPVARTQTIRAVKAMGFRAHADHAAMRTESAHQDRKLQ